MTELSQVGTLLNSRGSVKIDYITDHSRHHTRSVSNIPCRNEWQIYKYATSILTTIILTEVSERTFSAQFSFHLVSFSLFCLAYYSVKFTCLIFLLLFIFSFLFFYCYISKNNFNILKYFRFYILMFLSTDTFFLTSILALPFFLFSLFPYFLYVHIHLLFPFTWFPFSYFLQFFLLPKLN